jgi:hypothetical protein
MHYKSYEKVKLYLVNPFIRLVQVKQKKGLKQIFKLTTINLNNINNQSNKYILQSNSKVSLFDFLA